MKEILGEYWAYITGKGDLIPTTVRESMKASDTAVRASQPGRHGARVERIRVEVVRVRENENMEGLDEF